ncbi:MAG TPA: hypothetical protein DF383_09370, partial [Deltaproteobacteria bacterium]|nr:hypothetical protein [Deltaproteobacteria bacterium]
IGFLQIYNYGRHEAGMRLASATLKDLGKAWENTWKFPINAVRNVVWRSFSGKEYTWLSGNESKRESA